MVISRIGANLLGDDTWKEDSWSMFCRTTSKLLAVLLARDKGCATECDRRSWDPELI